MCSQHEGDKLHACNEATHNTIEKCILSKQKVPNEAKLPIKSRTLYVWSVVTVNGIKK